MKKYDIIYTMLEREIRTGKYMLGFRLPADKDLCKRFSASRPTVARALGELESVGLVERKIGSGTFITHNAPDIRKRYKFGLLIPGLGETEIFDQICGHLSHLAETGNFKLLWYGSMDSGPQERACRLEQLALRYVEEKVDGVFFTPLELTTGKDQINLQITSIFKKHNISIVLMDRDVVNFPNRSEYDLVSIDNFRIGYLMTQHLIEQGCKSIDFLARPLSAPSVSMRMAGYMDALTKSGLPFSEKNIHIGEPLAEETMKGIVESNPRGIFCANDNTAAKLIQSLSRKKIDVPSQIMVASVDDLAYAKYLTPTLTTYCQPYQDIAYISMKTLIERIENNTSPAKTILLMGKIITRESTITV